MQASKIPAFQKKLLKWYHRNARDLPWRLTRDPYKIWVSEIMLQQTQVVTVLDYYKKWVKRFPTVQSLAKSPLSRVLHAWAGLGYYRRARMLHEGAKTVCKNYGGKLPSTAEELIKLPGIGRYTAGAIASIAFDQKAPVLDGNVMRILTRLFAMRQDITKPKTVSRLWQIAENVLPDKGCGDFNQAMMELGAIICLPDNPKCPACPVRTICLARQSGKERNFPVRKQRERIQKLNSAALVWIINGKLLLQKQSKEGRWGGLWMFPHWQSKTNMLKAISAKSSDLKKLMTLHHSYTKYRIRLDVYRLLKSAKPSYNTSIHSNKWVRQKDLKKYGFPAPHKLIARSLPIP